MLVLKNSQNTNKDIIKEDEGEEILKIQSEDSKNNEDNQQNAKFICDFIIGKTIGEGTFSTVKLAVNRQTGEKVAIKIMEKNKIIHMEDKIRMEREIQVLKILRHPNIVHLYSVVETNDKIYLIMEYIQGKELFDYIVLKKKLSEKEACIFFQQLISGLEYLHKMKYIHRDIKPENLLIKEDTKELTIVDFGLTNIYNNKNKKLLTSACGSPSYAAPEMLKEEKYKGPPVDIWSCGIVLYAMLCGYLPFEDEDNNNDVLYDKICKGKFIIPNHVSEKARDLLNNILTTDPKKRLNIFQIKNHPWFSLYDNKGKLMISEGLILSKIVIPIDEEIVNTMFKEYNINKETIRVSILSNKHDNISTIYYLLLNKKINRKKKSEADIKSSLFKKYCENKNNLMNYYNNDIKKVINERKNGIVIKKENSNKRLNNNEIFSQKKRKNNKVKKCFSPEEKRKIQDLNIKTYENEANFNLKSEIYLCLNKNNYYSQTENNNDNEKNKKKNYNKKRKNKLYIERKSFDKNSEKLNINKSNEETKSNLKKNIELKEKNNTDIKILKNIIFNNQKKDRNKNNKTEHNISNSNHKRYYNYKDIILNSPNKDNLNITHNLKIEKINKNELSERIETKLANSLNKELNYYSDDIPSIKKKKMLMKVIYENQRNPNQYSVVKRKLIPFLTQNIYQKILNNPKIIKKKINNSKIRKNKFISSKHTETSKGIKNLKENCSINIDDSLNNSSQKKFCFEPFDLTLIYFKSKKVLEKQLISLLDKDKINYRIINKKNYIVELKKEKASLSLQFVNLNEINKDKKSFINNNQISKIKMKRINGGYQNNLNSFEKIICKLN